MNKLDKTQLPFPSSQSQNLCCDMWAGLDTAFLLETAFQAYPETWQDEAFQFLEETPEFLARHSMVLPKSADDDPNFNASEILAMQIICNRNALEELKVELNVHSNKIIDRLLDDPVIQQRMSQGEFITAPEDHDHLDLAS